MTNDDEILKHWITPEELMRKRLYTEQRMPLREKSLGYICWENGWGVSEETRNENP